MEACGTEVQKDEEGMTETLHERMIQWSVYSRGENMTRCDRGTESQHPHDTSFLKEDVSSFQQENVMSKIPTSMCSFVRNGSKIPSAQDDEHRERSPNTLCQSPYEQTCEENSEDKDTREQKRTHADAQADCNVDKHSIEPPWKQREEEDSFELCHGEKGQTNHNKNDADRGWFNTLFSGKMETEKKFPAADSSDDEETHKENHGVSLKRKLPEPVRENWRKNHRKSSSPNHVAANTRRSSKVLQGLKHRPTDENLPRLEEDTVARKDTEDDTEVVNEDGDLLKFAEILYKCSLCTTLPCILTSQCAFLSHVRENHVAKHAPGEPCPLCHLRFQTQADLHVHMADSHSCSQQENQDVDSDVSDAGTDQRLAVSPSENTTSYTQPDDEWRERGEDSERREVEGADRENSDYPREISDHRHEHTDDETGSESTTTTTITTTTSSHDDQASVRSSSTPLATVEYHSNQPLRQLEALSRGQQMSPGLSRSPLHRRRAEKNGNSLFNTTSPEGLTGFPSFTPEFGRFTKLVREGGRIVYFCQVCNVKCQVKAAFQVHCNGARHHNAVNMAAKNKTHVSSPPRDWSLGRTPLREVPVAGAQLTSPPRGDDCFLVERMTKFFHDHPDVSSLLSHSKLLSSGADLGGGGVPVNFCLKDRSRDYNNPESEDPRAKGTNTNTPDEVRSPFYLENLSSSPQGFSKKHTHGLGLGRESCTTPEPISASEANRSDNTSVYDLTRRSRKRPGIPGFYGESPDAQFFGTCRVPSSPSSACGALCVSGTDVRASRYDDDADNPSHTKRIRTNTSPRHETQNASQVAGNLNDSSRKVLTYVDTAAQSENYVVGQSDFTHHKQTDNSSEDHTHTSSSRTTNKEGNCLSERVKRDVVNSSKVTRPHSTLAMEEGHSTIDGGSTLSIKHAPSVNSPSCHRTELDDEDHQPAVTERTPHGFAEDVESCFVPAALQDSWFGEARAREAEQSLRWTGSGGGGGGGGDLYGIEDVVVETSKGQNNEGWKVTQIRDVLKGILASSNKGSSVSRDVLLHRVSLVLRSPDALHWGPACNRAVRDLFPHCLAQRKGKFKKTYFFGLSLMPGLEETKGGDLAVDGTSFRPLRDMTQDLEQLLEHLPGLLYWSGHVDRGVSRDDVLHALAARLSEGEVFQWGMQCNKALRMLFPLVLMKRKGKYKTTMYFGVEFTSTAQRLLPGHGTTHGQSVWSLHSNTPA